MSTATSHTHARKRLRTMNTSISTQMHAWRRTAARDDHVPTMLSVNGALRSSCCPTCTSSATDDDECAVVALSPPPAMLLLLLALLPPVNGLRFLILSVSSSCLRICRSRRHRRQLHMPCDCCCSQRLVQLLSARDKVTPERQPQTMKRRVILGRISLSRRDSEKPSTAGRARYKR